MLAARHEHRGGTKAGFTLFEVLLGLSIASIVVGLALASGGSLLPAFDTTSSLITVEGRARQVGDRVADLLDTAGADTLDPPLVAPPLSTASVDFQRPTGYAAGNLVWGNPERIRREPAPEDPDDGVDNDGDGLVDEGILVWIEEPGTADERRHVLGSGVAESLEGEIPGNGLDDNGNGLIDEGGFALTIEEGLLTFWITVERRVAGSLVLRRTVRRAIALDN